MSKKVNTLMIVALLAVTILAACTPAVVATEAPVVTEAPAVTEAPVATEAPTEAPLVITDTELNVLCTPQEEWCQGMKQEFEAKYGITVNYVRMSSGEALPWKFFRVSNTFFSFKDSSLMVLSTSIGPESILLRIKMSLCIFR